MICYTYTVLMSQVEFTMHHSQCLAELFVNVGSDGKLSAQAQSNISRIQEAKE